MKFSPKSILILVLASMSVIFENARTAPPKPPARFYGTVLMDGKTVPAGLSLTAWVGSRQVSECRTRLWEGESVYTIDVPGDDPETPQTEGALDGDAVRFSIQGYDAEQNGIWSEGAFEYLALSSNPPQSPPQAFDQAANVMEDTPLGLTLAGFDPNGDPLTYILSSQPANGFLSGTPPNVTYMPNPDYNGADQFTFRVHDGTAYSNTASVTITVSPVPDAPILQTIGDLTVTPEPPFKSRCMPLIRTWIRYPFTHPAYPLSRHSRTREAASAF